MKKLGFLAICVLVFSLFAIVSTAQAESTVVTGIIYEADYQTPVSGADVTVDCNGNIKTTTSLENGTYAVQYLGVSECRDGDTAYVTATKDGIGSGSNDGAVDDYGLIVDVAVVNVTIPEFGLIAGVIIFLGAGGGFMIIRRKGFLKKKEQAA